jgi:hypothetical protein
MIIADPPAAAKPCNDACVWPVSDEFNRPTLHPAAHGFSENA